MDIDLAALPDDVDTLQQMVRMLAAERAGLAQAQAEIPPLRNLARFAVVLKVSLRWR